MSVSIDIDGLEEFDEIGYEIVFADLVFGGIQSFHEVDECGQF